MLKKPSKISSPFSPIDSLKFSTFNYFGMGAVLASVAQSFWINFSAYYLNNILPTYGNIIFFLAQVSQGLGILIGWLLLAKFGKARTKQPNSGLSNTCHQSFIQGINIYMLIYILGATLLVSCFPLVFCISLSKPSYIFTFALLGKFGSGLMIISQLTIIPKITLNRNRRRKLVQKITQYGLAGTFISMFAMTTVSVYVNFIWKYFFGVCAFVFLGALCSIIYVYKIRQLVIMGAKQVKQKSVRLTNQIKEEPKAENIIECQIIKSPKFYIYALILVSCTLYMDIAIAIFPYFVKSFNNITHFRYLSAITVLYLSSFIASLITKNSFVFNGIRTVMTIGLGSCILATVLLVIGLTENQFDYLIVIATCLIGISKVIATNCALNLINQLIGLEVKSREFIYGFYYFIQKVITGFILYVLIKKVYSSEEVQFLHFAEIYLPFMLYSFAWVLIMVDRTLNDKIRKRSHIIIIEPNKQKTKQNSEQQDQQKVKSNEDDKPQIKEPVSSKFSDKYKKWVNKDFDITS